MTKMLRVLGLLAAFVSAGCVASSAGEVDSEDDVEGVSDEGVATNYYSCQTATVSGDGAKWIYQTSLFQPSSPSVLVFVQRWNAQGGVDDFGSVSLSKSKTGTFSDGKKVTLTWKTKSNGQPSIDIQHHSAGLKAGAANGFCTKTVVDLPTHTRHNFFYGGRAALSRKWKVYRVDNVLTDPSDPYVLDLSVDHVSDPSKKSSGLVELEAPCNPIATAPLTGLYANNTRAGVMGLLSTALNMWGAFNCASQGGTTDQLAGLTTFLGTKNLWKLPKDKFEKPCGMESSETLYANGYLFSNPNAIFVACVQMFDPTDSAHQPYVRMLAANPVDFEVSPWLTLIPAD